MRMTTDAPAFPCARITPYHEDGCPGVLRIDSAVLKLGASRPFSKCPECGWREINDVLGIPQTWQHPDELIIRETWESTKDYACFQDGHWRVYARLLEPCG